MCLSLLLNIILILSAAKIVSEISFCSRFKIHVLMVWTFAFAFKVFRPIFFLQSRNKVFHNQETFSQSRNFSTFKKPVHSQGTFAPSRKFSTKYFTWSRKFYANDKVFFSQVNFPQNNSIDQRNFLQTRKFSPKIFFLDQGSFSTNKNFYYSFKIISANKDRNISLKLKF